MAQSHLTGYITGYNDRSVSSREDTKGRQVCVLKRIAVFMIIMFIVLISVPGLARSGEESYVIGRIKGTFQELPGYFYKNPYMLSSGVYEVEFTGFRFLRVEDGKKFRIRPNHGGYFHQRLPGGEYILTRKRNDRPDYREPKTIDIMSFEVKPGTLVNLGTINLLLDGQPHESLWLSKNTSKGTYTYRYHYERESGEKAYDAPLNWFTEKKSKIATSFGDRVVREETALTGEWDGSKVELRVIVPWDDR
jgi:hypothetical protein